MCNDNSLEWILNSEERLKYMLLSRMQMDCEYFLNWGMGNVKRLWALDIEKQIMYMKAIWENLNEKPEWLSYEQILEYEKRMLNVRKENKNEL